MKAMEDKEATDKRAVKEAVLKVAADKEVADKRATGEALMKEAAVGAVRDSSASARCLPQWQAPRGRRCQAAPPHRLNDPTGEFENLGLSNFLVFCFFFFSYRRSILSSFPFRTAPLPPVRH
jgi:hypothetical protein